MSHAPKSNTSTKAALWRPSASIAYLKQRARIIASIRDFFNKRNMLEVETPLMCHTSVTDPFIQSIPALFQAHGDVHEQRYYLQTSPEYAMKRLLAAGSGDIFQITKAFRQSDVGRYHNPEFTMLEWYRLGFDHHALMDEMDVLLQTVLAVPPAKRMTYAELFQHFLSINPHTVTLDELKQCAQQHQLVLDDTDHDVDTWLDILMSHLIEPMMPHDTAWFVYDFPISKASLARIQPGNPPTASRFEVYYKGIELANGFHELQQSNEQRTRFEKNLQQRQAMGLNVLPIDELFLTALQAGLPDCAGVALGVDRLVMLALGANSLADIMSFDFARV
jgi:lysyl-tRNA synthetase class 2